ncbi:hypothetical protein CWC39_06180 [Corynebacterium heidelbergense]|uniref:Uncharacterized protein n=2 Tax=Corynebacterium heidelbergense TaxID=2055947 RepID=A0A364VB47_9CORY|nr:hypothetical protein CWC39_06180 [Corynebacterium heidelbergense]
MTTMSSSPYEDVMNRFMQSVEQASAEFEAELKKHTEALRRANESGMLTGAAESEEPGVAEQARGEVASLNREEPHHIGARRIFTAE